MDQGEEVISIAGHDEVAISGETSNTSINDIIRPRLCTEIADLA